MSATISPPVRVFAVVGVLVATGLATAMLLLGRTAAEPETAASTTALARPAVTQTARPVRPASAPTAPAPKASVPAAEAKSGFPRPIVRAFGRHQVIVVAVYVPGAGVDSVVRAEARAAASRSGTGFVAISAANERAIRMLVAKTGVLRAPAVVILKRPGVVSATFGATERGTIAQAIAQARR